VQIEADSRFAVVIARNKRILQLTTGNGSSLVDDVVNLRAVAFPFLRFDNLEVRRENSTILLQCRVLSGVVRVSLHQLELQERRLANDVLQLFRIVNSRKLNNDLMLSGTNTLLNDRLRKHAYSDAGRKH